MTMMRLLLLLACLFFLPTSYAQKVLNIYAWGGEIPESLLVKFTQETGIKVNFATYDNNETMFAKLRTTHHPQYDVIIPSTYFVEHMQKQGMLTALDPRKLPQLAHIDPFFMRYGLIKQTLYGVPLIWGATGIFVNHKHILKPPRAWKDLWALKTRRQLMLLDDPREMFAMALMSLGYKPSDENPAHIHAAYEQLIRLVPLIKLFASDGIQALLIDGDAMIGTAWNGDVAKAQTENRDIDFIYPSEGFVVWIDCVAIPKHAPHLPQAYAFINFLLKPESGLSIAQKEGHAITNRDSRRQLSPNIRDNPVIYPSAAILKRAYIQHDLSDEVLALYNEYWEALKLSF